MQSHKRTYGLSSLNKEKLVKTIGGCLVLGLLVCLPVLAQEAAILPRPVSLTPGDGSFTLSSRTVIVTSRQTEKSGRLLANYLRPATGFDLRVRRGAPPTSDAIALEIDAADPALARLGAEGYTLRITRDRVSIRASGDAGVFYGIQTLRQLLPSRVFAGTVQTGVEWQVPTLTIEDYPRFGWRGAMMDVSRHFMPKEAVLKFIDQLALHKMNTFHWHLTDDQGWRLEIKRYPRLTTIGSMRKESRVGHENQKNGFDGKPHGGFYTQAEIREVVAFARERFVNIVPEIEMPGHARAAIAAYPELGNTDEKLEVGTVWGIYPNVFNVKESTILFLQNVLDEVLRLFPSKFIHVGGDEVLKEQWKASSVAQSRMKELGLKDEHELQSYFIQRMDKFLAAKGRRLIGWDEILEGGLAPGATVMSWRGNKGGIAAARAGHDVVMAPNSHTYLDYYQVKDPGEPLAIGGFLPVEKVYEFEPAPEELSSEEKKRILGGQCQLWTEYIPTPEQLEYMAFPRLLAVAEAVWTPPERKDYASFQSRLEKEKERLRVIGVNFKGR
ncbi:MAG: beta-N-acetylhexosaminidase [Acidobacteriota bacterium]